MLCLHENITYISLLNLKFVINYLNGFYVWTVVSRNISLASIWTKIWTIMPRFVMVPLNLTDLNCLQHSLYMYEHLFNVFDNLMIMHIKLLYWLLELLMQLRNDYSQMRTHRKNNYVLSHLRNGYFHNCQSGYIITVHGQF